MAKFKVGDKVEVINGSGTNLAYVERIGEYGTIRRITQNWFSTTKQTGYLVEFDKIFQRNKELVYLETSIRHLKEHRVLDILRNAISKGVIGKTRV